MLLPLSLAGRTHIKQINTSFAECQEARTGKDGKWCTPTWGNTGFSCIFKLADDKQQCGYPRGPCEKKAFCEYLMLLLRVAGRQD